ncbi:MAG: iron ABC transporter permease [Victivallaceae bacterium]|nr:iron ABC transporter permease [Victivallaceae bacterium]
MKPLRIITLTLLSAFFVIFLILPIYSVVKHGLNPTVLAECFRNPIYLEGLFNSFKIAIVATAITFVIAMVPALVYDRYDFTGKKLVNTLMLIPMILPPFVGALGFMQIFGHYGTVNTILTSCGIPRVDWLGGGGRFWMVCVIEALHLYPILYLNILTALANVDPALNEAARNLGAGRWRRFRQITLPMIRPGVFAGGTLILIWSFTELGTPLMFGYNRVTTVQIFNGITELETNPLPYALVVIMLVAAAALYAVSRIFLGKSSAIAMTKGMSAPNTRKLTKWGSILALSPFAAVVFMAGLPHIALILTAFSVDWYGVILPKHFTLAHFENALSHDMVTGSIVNSLKYSSLAMLVCVTVGIITAVIITRWRPRGWQIFDTLSMMPLAIPGIIMAFGFLSMSTNFPIARMFLDPMKNPFILLGMAYAIRRLPYVTRAAAAGLEQTPLDLEEAARNLGAGSWSVMRRIVIPLISANIAVGALFAFSFSMLEVSDSLLLAHKKEFYPITKAIFELSGILGSGPWIACAFGVWTMAFLACTLAAANAILGKKMGSLFRF